MILFDKPENPNPPGQRKPYITPQLIRYGHVKDIVQGSGGPASDGGSGNTRPPVVPCWIAEALYGVEDPRTIVLRSWMLRAYVERRGWWFLVVVYRVVGPTIASLIRRDWVPRGALLPLFDFLVRAAFDESANRLPAATSQSG
jgi:hypothetical protein